jgi:hypothetical protein
MVHPHITHYEVLSHYFDSFVLYRILSLSPCLMFVHFQYTLKVSGAQPPCTDRTVFTFDTEFLLEKSQGNRITWEKYIVERIILKWTLEK